MFTESAILRYEPAQRRFTRFDLPVIPKGSETPYSLNVDRKRHQVWVTGNQFRFAAAPGHRLRPVALLPAAAQASRSAATSNSARTAACS